MTSWYSDFPQQDFFANRVIFTKLTIFGNTKQVIQDYDTVFDNSIPFRKNDPLRMTYFRIPGGPALCLGTEAPPEANVKWFSVASPGPAGNFCF